MTELWIGIRLRWCRVRESWWEARYRVRRLWPVSRRVHERELDRADAATREWRSRYDRVMGDVLSGIPLERLATEYDRGYQRGRQDALAEVLVNG